MNLKKIVSAASALTIAASAFASMSIVASADTVTDIYSNDFNAATAGLIDFGKSDGVVTNGGTTLKNTAGSGVIGAQGVSGDRRLAIGNISSMQGYDSAQYVDVELDFKYDSGTKQKSNTIGLFGATRTSGDAWAVNEDKQILTINCKDDNSWNVGTVTVNGDDCTALVKETGAIREHENNTAGSTGWVHLYASIDFVTSKVTYTLSKGGTALHEPKTVSFLGTGNNAPTALDCVALIVNNNKNGLYMDNLTITKIDKSVPKAHVTFTGNATSVIINGKDVSTTGIDLPAGTYSYTAEAGGYDTQSGEFTVTAEDVTAKAKAVDIQLTAIPAAPANTNSTEAKASDNTAVFTDGYMTNTNAAHKLNIMQGDKVVFECDVYVADGKTANFTLKTAKNNGTGANVKLTAVKDTVTADYEAGGGDIETIGTYPANQWAHVKFEFTAAAPDDKTPADDIRTSNVGVTITPCNNGTAISKTGIPARNIDPNFDNEGTKEYSFGSIDFSGACSIANAEVYAIGTRTPSTVAVSDVKTFTTHDDLDYTVFKALVKANSFAVKALNFENQETDKPITEIAQGGEAVFIVTYEKAAIESPTVTPIN